MKACKKYSDGFRNMVIILDVLCYTFIHIMEAPVLIILCCNLIILKPDGLVLFLTSYY